MRVISGTARRLQLKTIPGMDTRPTTDRIKETLFNMLNQDIAGSVFLDLFAGSGQIGIEALSRGAKKAVFIEQDRGAAGCIKENLEFTRLADRGEILCTDVLSGLKRLEGKLRFDFIFMDPPYGKLLEKQALEYLRYASMIHEDTIIIVEADLETDFSYLEDLGFVLLKRKQYKTNAHLFIGL